MGRRSPALLLIVGLQQFHFGTIDFIYHCLLKMLLAIASLEVLGEYGLPLVLGKQIHDVLQHYFSSAVRSQNVPSKVFLLCL